MYSTNYGRRVQELEIMTTLKETLISGSQEPTQVTIVFLLAEPPFPFVSS